MHNKHKMQPLSFWPAVARKVAWRLSVGALLFAGIASAQTAATPEPKPAAAADDSLAEITVTGSLIRTPSSAAVGSAVIAVDQPGELRKSAHRASLTGPGCDRMVRGGAKPCLTNQPRR